MTAVTTAAPSPEPIPPVAFPPIDVPPYPAWLTAAAALLALAVLGAVALLLWRWWRKSPPPPLPGARAMALRELEQLRAQVRTAEPYAFSIAVSDVLRRFASAQFGLAATRQTSPEFLGALAASRQFGPEDQRLLGEFLEKCDAIKFAHVDATPDDSADLLGNAIAFVQGSRAA